MVLEVAPRSLFGRHSYPTEQRLMLALNKQIDYTVALVSPMSIGVPLPLQRLPADFRRKKIREHLVKAQELIKEIGI
jgi:hypothetical protein